MRIVAGKFGGRVLETPKNRDVRPTSDKVRGAVFNALQSRGVVHEARVIDCFCGTGALGLEALSQGASSCTFIDKDCTSLDLAKDNAARLGLKDEVSFLLKDAAHLKAISEDVEKFTLAFLDPPYGQDLLTPTLLILHNQLWVEDGAIMVAEVEKKFEARQKLSRIIPDPFRLLDERTYGDTKILFLRYEISPE